jgi:hypothetical protein
LSSGSILNPAVTLAIFAFAVNCHAYCGRKSLSLLPPRKDGDQLRLGEHIAVPFHRRTRSRSAGHILFHRTDFNGREAEAIGNWLAESKRIPNALVLYLAGVYSGGFRETKLLALTQAVEAFHRQFRPGAYMDQETFDKEVVPPLEKAVSTIVSAAHRDAINSKLKFANE